MCDGLRLREWVIPPYNLRGDTVELRCDYEPGNSSIYSVKWFKDDDEFFRYVPRDSPPRHFFPRVGITLDETLTQPGRVVLLAVGFNTSGQYRCEVSAEGPDFNTVTGHGSLMVVEPPTSGPVITGGRSKYHVNDTVDLVCTSSPSRPPSHLSWKINGRPAPQELVTSERPYLAHDGLLTQISRLTFLARPFHFQRGVLRIKCVAEISGDRLIHHNTIPQTFRAWERSFQASAGGRVVAASLALFTLCAALTLTASVLVASTTSTSVSTTSSSSSR
ncbi:uncharacterized protein [Cherax quadricarinatus]|uniref:uncharacterized protein n=1 Tax=Cherax quadricarinatus TaxID=27406 RepID=UPI00387ED123